MPRFSAIGLCLPHKVRPSNCSLHQLQYRQPGNGWNARRCVGQRAVIGMAA